MSFIAKKTTGDEDTEEPDVTEDREDKEEDTEDREDKEEGNGGVFKAGNNPVLSVVGL